jgi:hypothetical protein
MRVRQEIRFGITILLLLQLGTSFSALVLLGRMTPALDHLVADNLDSMRAASQMLAALTLEATEEGASDRFLAALDAARHNVTEPAEAPRIAALDRDHPAALATPPGSPERARLAAEVLALSEVNREAVVALARRTNSLGRSGAWAAALLALLTLALSAWVVSRLAQVIAEPLERLFAVMAVHQEDRPGRPDPARCRTEGPPELRLIAEGINRLLDARLQPPPPSRDDELRDALLQLLDREDAPVMLVRPGGDYYAMNTAARERLASDGDGARLRERLGELFREDPSAARSELERLGVEVEDAGALYRVRLPREKAKP